VTGRCPGAGFLGTLPRAVHPPTLARTVLATALATLILGAIWGEILLADLGDWRFLAGGALAAPLGLLTLGAQLLVRAWYLRRVALLRRSPALRRTIYAVGPGALGLVLLASLWMRSGGMH
jgi:hypothetical protein